MQHPLSAAGIKSVLMTGDTVGGVWTYTLELAEALGAMGIQVTLCTFGGKPSADQWDAANAVPNLRLLPGEEKIEWMDDPWADVERSGRRLLRLEEEFEPDVVHLNTYGHGTLPWRKPVILTAHSCVLSWWDAVEASPLPPLWKRYQAEVARALSSVSLVTAPSNAMLKALQSNYGPSAVPCLVIPNGRKPGLYYQTVKEKIILSAGRLWDEAKNIRLLTQVAPRLSWPVYIAGYAHHPNGSVAEFPDCRLLGCLAPHLLASWYARASIYAMPARYEPFGLSILEAALSHCALVLGDIESLREIWGDAAMFVPPADPCAFEAALRQLMDDDRKRLELARRSFERAQTFTPERMAAGYLDAYRAAQPVERHTCIS